MSKRDERTKWQNENPITDTHEALEFLQERHQGRYSDKRYIYTAGKTPEVRVDWYREADSGGDRGGTDYYQIDSSVAQRLIAEKWVQPRKIRHMGYTETQEARLELSPLGKDILRAYLESERGEAKRLIEPGVHTQFSGVLNPAGHGREKGDFGGLYFDFKTPMNEHVRVHMKTRKVERLPAKKFA